MKQFFSPSYLLAFCSLFVFTVASQAQNSIGRVGSADVTTSPTGGALLMGGAGDNDDAMRWMLTKADGGDIVVLRTTGTDAYNDYLFNLGPAVNSVETLLIDSRSKANNTTNEQIIRNAEALFITGGDQFFYMDYWKDTRVEDAINYLINTKGAVVGGTSAGCAIQGNVYFDATNGTVTSPEVLADPYTTNATLQRNNFINHPMLANTITDTHYDNPDRKGRHTGFLARMVTDWSIDAKGIGVDEYTAVCVEPNGIAKVFGDPNYDDFAYFLQSYGGSPETCTAGSPLTWDRNGEAVKVYKISGTNDGARTFDLNDWTTGNGGIWEDFYVTNGTLQITSPSNAPSSTPICNTPTGLLADNIAQTSADISWASTGASAYDFRYRESGTTSWTNSSTSATNATLSGLIAGTDYEFRVRSDCGPINSSYSSFGTFTTQAASGGGPSYCASSGDSYYEYIDRVQIGSLNNTSGSDGGYADNTGNVATDLEAGYGYNIRLTPGFRNSTYTEYFEVYIDFNQDGDFDDADESVYYGRSRRGRRISGTVSIPSNAFNGNTRMRVSMSYDNYPTPCESIPGGEVEDYTVNIFGGANARNTSALSMEPALEVSLYPNPAQRFFQVKSNAQDAQLTVFDMTGKTVLSQAFSLSEKIEIAHWKEGVYIVEVSGGNSSIREKIIVVK